MRFFFPHDTQWVSQEKNKENRNLEKPFWVSRKKEKEDEHLEK